jgi:hypothetical protein
LSPQVLIEMTGSVAYKIHTSLIRMLFQ